MQGCVALCCVSGIPRGESVVGAAAPVGQTRMRILIVDDRALIRRGLTCVVKEAFPAAHVEEAEDGTATLRILRSRRVDLVMVDVYLPDSDGLALLRAIKIEWPVMPVIMCSTGEEGPYIKPALDCGAVGYLLGDATLEDLSRAIGVAVSGEGIVLTHRAIKALFAHERPSRTNDDGWEALRITGLNLTSREHRILALLMEGRSNRAIGQSLFLSEKTVKSHLISIFRKLGVTSRTQAAMMAAQLGVQPESAAVTE